MDIGIDMASGPDVTAIAEFRVFWRATAKTDMQLRAFHQCMCQTSIAFLRLAIARGVVPSPVVWRYAISISQGKRKHWLRREARRHGVML